MSPPRSTVEMTLKSRADKTCVRMLVQYPTTITSSSYSSGNWFMWIHAISFSSFVDLTCFNGYLYASWHILDIFNTSPMTVYLECTNFPPLNSKTINVPSPVEMAHRLGLVVAIVMRESPSATNSSSKAPSSLISDSRTLWSVICTTWLSIVLIVANVVLVNVKPE